MGYRIETKALKSTIYTQCVQDMCTIDCRVLEGVEITIADFYN